MQKKGLKRILTSFEGVGMAKPKTRTELELEKGKKTLYAWIESENKEWLDQEACRQRRTVAATIDTILEDCRMRQQAQEQDDAVAGVAS